MAEADLAYELAVLRAVPGTSQVNDSGNEGDGLNKTSVKLFLPGGKVVPHDPSAQPKMIRIHCSTSVPTKLEAARKLKATLSDVLGPEVIAAAEETVRAQHAAAAAAAAAAGEGSSTAPALNAFDVMGLRSKLDCAEIVARRAEAAAGKAETEAALAYKEIVRAPEEARKAAWQAVADRSAALQAALDTLGKRQRTEAPAATPADQEPVWRSREYACYETVAKWLELETKVYVRRRVPLDPKKLGRSPEELRRGEQGPMHHWRRGMVGAVLDWAEGSEADAATLVLMLIEELELQVLVRPRAPGWPRGATATGARHAASRSTQAREEMRCLT